jgi:AraC-like DNA-binding protein/ligand-binding sensor protein
MASLLCRPTLPPIRPAPLRASPEATVVARVRQSALFRRYQRAFEASTGFPLVLREAGSFRTPLEGSKRINPFCALLTHANQTCAACLQLQQRTEAEATLGPRTLRCHAGLSETAVPVRVGDTVLGYLQTGQVFLRPPTARQFRRVLRTFDGAAAGVGRRELESAYFQSRVLTRKQYEPIIRLLAIFAEHLGAVSNQLLIGGATAELSVVTRGRRFIAEHQGEGLTLGAVARAVHMNACYFCKVFKKATGVGFTEYLARARVESVKQLLLNANLRIGEAAFAAGFQSLSQFNRTFHRFAGEAPSRYRDRLHTPDARSAAQHALVHAA